MPSSPAERDEYAEYFSPSGAITCRVLYRSEQLAFVQFRTEDWPGYREFGYYARVALFPEHLRPADPHSPGVVGFAEAIAKEVAAQIAYQHQPSIRERINSAVVAKASPRINGQGAPTLKPSANVTQGNGVKPLSSEPVKPPARGRKASASGEDAHSLKPVRSIAGLTLADFLHGR